MYNIILWLKNILFYIKNYNPICIPIHIPIPIPIHIPIHIPIILHEVGCYTLEDVVGIIVYGFNDYNNITVKLALSYFKQYIEDNYSSKFKDGVMISIPHKTDPWKSLSSNGKYLVCANISKTFCHSRWLLRVRGDNVHFLQQFMVQTHIPLDKLNHYVYTK